MSWAAPSWYFRDDNINEQNHNWVDARSVGRSVGLTKLGGLLAGWSPEREYNSISGPEKGRRRRLHRFQSTNSILVRRGLGWKKNLEKNKYSPVQEMIYTSKKYRKLIPVWKVQHIEAINSKRFGWRRKKRQRGKRRRIYAPPGENNKNKGH